MFHLRLFLASNRGFTLIELMVAIGVLSILGTIGIVTYSGVQGTGRDTKRAQDLRQVITSMELYRQAVGNFPASSCVGSLNTVVANFSPNYINQLPRDPKCTSAPAGAACDCNPSYNDYFYYLDATTNKPYLYARLEKKTDLSQCPGTPGIPNTNFNYCLSL